ncbi:MAG: ATP synthase F1 subunit epsilon [Acidobacteriota bacterium]
MAGTFSCSVVTPEKAILDVDDAVQVVFPAYDGEMGIMAGRAPLLSRLGIGRLRLKTASGEEQLFFVDGGFAQMVDNRLTILTEQALALDEISESAALSAQETADAIAPGGDERTYLQRQAALERARQLRRLAARN